MLGEVTITITPQSGSYGSTGRFTPAASHFPYTVLASVQDIDPRKVEMLPEAARVRCRKQAFIRGTGLTITPTDLSTKHPGDRVTYNSKTYVIDAVEDYQDHTLGLPHVVAYLAEVGVDE